MASVGRASPVLITVQAGFAGPGATTYTIMAQASRVDPANPATWNPQTIVLERLDGGAPPGVQQDIVAADLVGPNGAPVDVAFTTAGAELSGDFDLFVKADATPVDGDFIVLAIDAG